MEENQGLEAASENQEIVEDNQHDTQDYSSDSSKENDIESQAREDGWDENRYSKDDPKYVTAEDFLERGKHINRILRSKLKRQEKEMEDLRNGVNEFKKFSQAQIDRKQVELQSALNDLKSAKADAIRNGDGEEVNRIDVQIDEAKDQLREAKSAPQHKEPTEADRENNADFEKWKSRNEWYGSNTEATKAADDIAAKLRRQGENRTGMAFLRLVDEMVRDDKPELFTNQNRNRPGAVSGSGSKSGGESLESFKRGLSRTDHDFMVLGVREGWYKDEADFMAQYKAL